MSDSKLTALTAETTVAMTDIAYFVDDPGGTPLSRKCTIANLSKGIDLSNVPTASGAVTLQPAAGSNLNVTLATTGDFTVNTNQLYVDTSVGNVGIGTTTPTSGKLQIETPAGVNFQNAIYLVKSDGYGGSAIQSYYTSPLNYGLGLAVAGDSKVVVNKAGNVGIGTTSPDDRLHVTVGTTDAVECLKLEQLDVSEGFANFVSTSAANTTNPITTWTTGGAIAGFVRIAINGTDQWMPFYSAPTS